MTDAGRGSDGSNIRLARDDEQALLDLYRRSADPGVRLRARSLLLLDAGFPWATISAVLFCSPLTAKAMSGSTSAG